MLLPPPLDEDERKTSGLSDAARTLGGKFLLISSKPQPGTRMSKPKHDVANALKEVEMDSAGFAHGLHLLLLAIARTNPAVGALLDEFTSMHAEYHAELQQLARENADYIPVMEQFARSARMIYQRLAALDSELWAQLGSKQFFAFAS
jgi:hypothetical protein